MRHLLGTVAVAALIAVAARASAQTPTSTGRHGFDPSDHVANELNAQQLGHAAAPSPHPAAAAPPPGYGTPAYGPPGFGPPGYGPMPYRPPYGPYGHPGWGYAPPVYPWGPPGAGFPPPY